MAKKSNVNYLYWLIPLLIVGIILFLVIVNSISPTGKVVSSTDTLNSQETSTPTQNCHDVQVPYTDQECNDVYMIWKPEYVDMSQSCIQEECASYNQVCVEYNWLGNCVRYSPQCASNKCVKYRKYCGLKIENKEREGATFNLELYKWNQDTQTSTLVTTQNLWVSPLDSATATWDFTYLPTESVSCWYTVTNNPTMQECRDVIRYRTEQQCD